MNRYIIKGRYSYAFTSETRMEYFSIFLTTGSINHPTISNFVGNCPTIAYAYKSNWANAHFINFADSEEQAKIDCAEHTAFGEACPDDFLGVIANLTPENVELFINSIHKLQAQLSTETKINKVLTIWNGICGNHG